MGFQIQEQKPVGPTAPSAGNADAVPEAIAVWPTVLGAWQTLADPGSHPSFEQLDLKPEVLRSLRDLFLVCTLLKSASPAAQTFALQLALVQSAVSGPSAPLESELLLPTALAVSRPADPSSQQPAAPLGTARLSSSSRSGPAPPAGAADASSVATTSTGSGGGGGGSNKAAKFKAPDIGTLWGLLILGVAYVHHSTTGFALPALLPLINEDLHLTDSQGALLTSGYTVLYAAALIPVGLLADRAERPRLLAAGIAAWSLLTMAASQVNGFVALLVLRVGFAVAQAAQNPVCFSLIPELFPQNRTTAMAAYNSAIYMGRALSFGAVILARSLGIPTGDIGIQMVPLDAVDPSRQSLLYTVGDQAAVTPIYDYDFSILYGAAAQSSWREILWWVGPPGLAIGALVLLTVDEPRSPGRNVTGPPAASSRFLPRKQSLRGGGAKPKVGTKPSSAARTAQPPPVAAVSAAAATVDIAVPTEPAEKESTWALVKTLCANPGFQAVTFASALNDVGSWALVAWQATFYQRVFEVGPEVYAPLLAAIIPVGGIIGGVGGGLAGDWLSRRGGRTWLTVGGSVAAAPVIAVSILAPDYQQSFAALLIGFALSECWRAPSAIMVRDVSPPSLGSTASAIHLCIRNFLGSCGPLGVAYLSERVGLQKAMLLVPSCYIVSGVAFWFAEKLVVRRD
eukprot:CAMPEP_0206137946 /NCGR_PEP_ID=MMETSP1473-20131121/2956_1 /ASSEMBLY_ACC=CAM_ASM_001109 /TAXON_ID=1461547 /ORGANISM="Stichococcus sp, Strain RCC1054" /LENGTH=682 /DNA_ID=CAMNT_0053531227 /DNA_START=245 /DNA_END=2294 /DNA_ORIENTATION=-